METYTIQLYGLLEQLEVSGEATGYIDQENGAKNLGLAKQILANNTATQNSKWFNMSKQRVGSDNSA